MSRLHAFLAAILFLVSYTFILPGVSSSALRFPSSVASAPDKYRRSVSLGESHNSDPRDGWSTFNATHLQRASQDVEPRSKTAGVSTTEGFLKAGLKAVGNTLEKVIITWYTGNDLKNPSCWSNSVWTPTDESFVCALTLEGWVTKPKCFQFLELCNGKKCVFVRVVDTCAGCAPGSQHVDLTKSAFGELADLSEGTMDSITMRLATDPTDWYEDLWGPKA